MKPLPGLTWGFALTAMFALGQPASAAWNNVFQVCCNHCGGTSAPVVANYGGDPCPQPCPAPCPPPVTCTTHYVQRSFYQPVTSYRTSHYYEPVTTYRTSYYYEPVTSYRYSCYYDPCTCRYQSVATPTTSYSLKSRCCPVTSYLQRTCMTPVTTYQQSFYYEPVTTCCSTTTGAPMTNLPPGATSAPPPGTAESREPMPPPPPGTKESREGEAGAEMHESKRTPIMPKAADSSYRPEPKRAPAVRIDRIASRGESNLEGKVILADKSPRSGAKILLVSVEAKSNQQTVTADRDGQFRARVDAGGWLVYTLDEASRPVFSRRVEVPADRPVTMTLTQR